MTDCKQLAYEAKQGNREAFGELYQEVYQDLYLFCIICIKESGGCPGRSGGDSGRCLCGYWEAEGL